MKIIFDMTSNDLQLGIFNRYLDSLKHLAFDDEIWVTPTQKNKLFSGYDQFYRGIPIIVKEIA